MENKQKESKEKKKGFWGRFVEALDKKIQAKAAGGCCCCKGKDEEKSCS